MVLKPRSELHTDDWGAYANLTRHAPNVVRHRVVVHAHSFTNPVTGAHTQEIESAWASYKLKIANQKGIKAQSIQSFLDEQMWRDHYTNPTLTFEDIIGLFSLYYPNHPQS